MGLFDKKYCDICGEKIGQLEDGNLCKDCAKKLSPWFSDRRSSTVSEIKEQLAYREKNRERAAQFRTTRSYGEDWKLLLDEEHRWFTVTRARDLADANPDILDYTALTGCRVDIDESRTEQMREDADGKEVSYVPPRYEYSYDFDIIISVNHPYFDEMRFRLNDSSVDIEPQSTVQRPMMGQRPMAGQMQRPMPGQMQRPMAGRPQPMGRTMMGQTMNVAPVNFDPENSMEYRKYREMGDEIRAALQQVMETARGGAAAQPTAQEEEEAVPASAAADAKETARILTALGVDIVKLHSLYIARNTRLCDWYENGKITVCSKEEYFERVITFLEQIPETVAVERMFSRIPEKDAVFCNWGCSWWRLRDELLQKMEEEGRYQGRCCDYLNGAALCLLKSE